MDNTKTREQILTLHLYYMKKYQGVPDYLCDMVTFNDALAAMSEYSSHQNKKLLERIKELEEGLARIAKGPFAQDSNEFTIHVVRIAKQLLNNKTYKV